jgi:hypothetical protein
MKFAAPLLTIWLGFLAGTAVAAATPEPVLPDPAYCSNRDANPEKCVIQDGPPHRPVVRPKNSPVQKSVPSTGSGSKTSR